MNVFPESSSESSLQPPRTVMGVPVTEDDFERLQQQLDEVTQAERLALQNSDDIILGDAA